MCLSLGTHPSSFSQGLSSSPQTTAKIVRLIHEDATLKSFFLLESAREETLLFAICKREDDERISFETRERVEEEVVQR